MSKPLLRQPNFPALVALVWLLVVMVLLLQHWHETAETLLDSDDAMRLVEVRSWLAGNGWFDLTEARLQPPSGYESHWSRLVDAGLGGLFMLFKPFVGAASAERLMRAWWPMLWLLPTIAGMVAIAWRIAGREAAMVALLLASIGVPGYQQFVPGRIDHHNVQIALTMLVTAAVAWSDRKRWTAAAAGALSGLSLTIGFETVPYLAACGAALAFRYIVDRDGSRPLRDYGLALAAATIGGFFVSVGPDHWLRQQCDAIAINSAGAAVCAGLVLAFAGWLSHNQALTRGLAIIGAGSAAMAVFVLIEKQCVGGPFAMVDPAIWPVWHSHVAELQPLLGTFRVNPLTAAGIAAFPAAALLATVVLAAESKLRRDFGFFAGALAFLAAVATMMAAVRGYPYAIWLGMPLVAAEAIRLFATFQLKTLAARLAAGAVLTPMVLSAGAITIAAATGMDDADSGERLATRACLRSANYAPLARLPAGLVAADINIGPYLLALTPHSVMAAPYHRLSTGIVAAHRALSAPPDEARAVLKQAKADYVMICGPRPPDGVAKSALDRSLWAGLRAGNVPGWLDPVPGGGAFAVYRVKQ